MPVKIHGKDYKTVAERINEFRALHGNDVGITTDLVSDEKGFVIIKASIIKEGVVIATGYAEEERGSTNINKTSALENCETSAIGRALANFGYAGTEYASAEEVTNAINQQGEKAIYERMTAHMTVVMDNIESVQAIKAYIDLDDVYGACQVWGELSGDEKKALWLATSKGGCFSTAERKYIQSDEFANARRGDS